jgi:hypothetical protein
MDRAYTRWASYDDQRSGRCFLLFLVAPPFFFGSLLIFVLIRDVDVVMFNKDNDFTPQLLDANVLSNIVLLLMTFLLYSFAHKTIPPELLRDLNST